MRPDLLFNFLKLENYKLILDVTPTMQIGKNFESFILAKLESNRIRYVGRILRAY